MKNPFLEQQKGNLKTMKKSQNKKIELNNFEKGFSLKFQEDEKQIISLIFSEKCLTLSFVFDKELNKILEISGVLGEKLINKFPKNEVLQKERVMEFIRFSILSNKNTT